MCALPVPPENRRRHNDIVTLQLDRLCQLSPKDRFAARRAVGVITSVYCGRDR
jgi:hypothetical protein